MFVRGLDWEICPAWSPGKPFSLHYVDDRQPDPDVTNKLGTTGRTSFVLLRGRLRQFDMQQIQQLLVLGFGRRQMLVHVGTA